MDFNITSDALGKVVFSEVGIYEVELEKVVFEQNDKGEDYMYWFFNGLFNETDATYTFSQKLSGKNDKQLAFQYKMGIQIMSAVLSKDGKFDEPLKKIQTAITKAKDYTDLATQYSALLADCPDKKLKIKISRTVSMKNEYFFGFNILSPAPFADSIVGKRLAVSPVDYAEKSAQTDPFATYSPPMSNPNSDLPF